MALKFVWDICLFDGMSGTGCWVLIAREFEIRLATFALHASRFAIKPGNHRRARSTDG